MTMWSEERIIAALQQFASTNGGCVSTIDARRFKSLPHPSTVQTRFGSWTDAMNAAGLTPFPRGRRPKDGATNGNGVETITGTLREQIAVMVAEQGDRVRDAERELRKLERAQECLA